MVISRRSLLLSGAAFPASAYAQCVTDRFAVDACRGGVRINGPSLPPGVSLDLSFLTPGTLDPRITFTRASTATYTDASGTIQTVAVNTPRWDYDPVTHALRGVLIEAARTNLLLQSVDLSNAAWVPGNLSVALPVVTGNSTMAPDGTTRGARIDLPAVPTGLNASSVAQLFVATAAVYTFSIWLKGNVGGEVTYIYTTQAATTYYRQQCVLTTQWQRFTLITGTLTAANWLFCVGNDGRGGGSSSTLAQSIYAWGAQLELGAFSTSYIPTTSAAVTRAQDIMTMPTGGWYNGTTGTIFAETLLPANGNNGYRTVFALDAGVSGQWLRGYTFAGLAQVNGDADASAVVFGTMTPGTPFKIAANYSSAIRVAFNGAMGTGAPGVLASAPTYTTLRFGVTDSSNSNPANGYIRRVQYWPRVLSDAEMQQVTT